MEHNTFFFVSNTFLLIQTHTYNTGLMVLQWDALKTRRLKTFHTSSFSFLFLCPGFYRMILPMVIKDWLTSHHTWLKSHCQYQFLRLLLLSSQKNDSEKAHGLLIFFLQCLQQRGFFQLQNDYEAVSMEQIHQEHLQDKLYSCCTRVLWLNKWKTSCKELSIYNWLNNNNPPSVPLASSKLTHLWRYQFSWTSIHLMICIVVAWEFHVWKRGEVKEKVQTMATILLTGAGYKTSWSGEWGMKCKAKRIQFHVFLVLLLPFSILPHKHGQKQVSTGNPSLELKAHCLSKESHAWFLRDVEGCLSPKSEFDSLVPSPKFQATILSPY